MSSKKRHGKQLLDIIVYADMYCKITANGVILAEAPFSAVQNLVAATLLALTPTKLVT